MKLRVALFALCMGWGTQAHRAGSAERYAGVHALGVNRVSAERRAGSVTIRQGDGGWELQGEARKGPYFLRLRGSLVRIDERELVMHGELQGVPDMRWADEPPRERSTRAKFTFRTTKGRKFWRLYEVDDRPCVCDEQCGNDFCYVDIDRARMPP